MIRFSKPAAGNRGGLLSFGGMIPVALVARIEHREIRGKKRKASRLSLRSSRATLPALKPATRRAQTACARLIPDDFLAVAVHKIARAVMFARTRVAPRTTSGTI
jgi:hypothetical protein